MTKQAADKIAEEYYALGVKLAQDKIANKALHKTYNALAGGTFGLASMGALTPKLREALSSKSDYLKNIFSRGDAIRELKNVTGDMEAIKPLLDLKMPGDVKVLKELADEASRLKGVIGDDLTNAEGLIDALPSLGLLGTGVGVYKGLGKLDKKLKLY